MKGTVTCVHTWNYEKEGKQKIGRSIDLQSIDAVNESDGRGNATIGYPMENIYIPTSFHMSDSELGNLVGSNVEIIYEKRIGQKYETLSDIKELSGDVR